MECVGTLLVPSSDLKELSQANSQEQVECVGSLLVHTSDVQELTDLAPGLPEVNLQKRVTVGTLLVTQSDLESPKEDTLKEKVVSIQRSATKRMTGPAPGDDESDTWAD
jgi:hypothetical protein